jgi:hypothetical protein
MITYFFFFFAKVLTLVGFPPMPCFTDLFLVTADLICDLLIDCAVDLGTHLGYFLFDSVVDFLPHFLNPPSFLGEPMSTQSSLNHRLNPPVGLATYLPLCDIALFFAGLSKSP